MKREIGKKGGVCVMTVKRLFSSKNFLTLISVLSVLVLFFGVCAGILFVLEGLHWISLPFGEEPMQSGQTEAQGEIFIPVYKPSENGNQNFHTEMPSCDGLLKNIPLAEAYYLHIYVTDYVNGVPKSEIYELWCYGEKYRLNHYNEDYEVQSMMTCDGEFVQIADYIAVEVRYYLKGEEYALKNVSPLPDFSKLLTKEHKLISYSEENGFCTVLYEYPEFHMSDEIVIKSADGLLCSYINRIGGKTVREVNVLVSDSSYPFDDDMFRISKQ